MRGCAAAPFGAAAPGAGGIGQGKGSGRGAEPPAHRRPCACTEGALAAVALWLYQTDRTNLLGYGLLLLCPLMHLLMMGGHGPAGKSTPRSQ